MSRFGGLSGLVWVSLPLAALAGRIHKDHKDVDKGGKSFKCSIHWEVPERGIAKTSFPVKSCLLNCKPFAQNRYDKRFSDVLKVVQLKRSCKCLQLDGKPLLKMPGQCPAEAEKQCFEFYKKMRTSTFEKQVGRTTATLIPHLELQDEKTFDYSNCEKTPCETDEACTESIFPSILEGRGQEEKSMIKDIIKKQKEEPGSLEPGEQGIIDQLTAEDIQEIMGDEFITDEFKDDYDAIMDEAMGPLTVKKLREIYRKKLQGTAISVDHLLNVAELTDDDHVVDLDDFKRFAQPVQRDCP